ncbi:3548_t:CDS:2 [Funneliformis mosseae]|uniref:3548_t:CDS:1 n=1 Tax=Funneliformis mosseae TaxID=27381 RepID=A0A9N9EW44_FUNMO|nr:3548_t:CDS:2 [Funneliformis mosseae]
MTTTKIDNFNTNIAWLERAISEDYIKNYDFAEFTNWEEISSGSGHKPFYAENVEYDADLIMKIKGGMREKIVMNTPIEYSNLYQVSMLER